MLGLLREALPQRRLALPVLAIFGGALFAGPLLAKFAAPVLLVALGVVAFSRTWSVALVLALGLAVGHARSRYALDAFFERRALLASIFPHPVRCTGRGTVVSPATRRGDIYRYEVEVEPSADCNGAMMPISFRAVLSGEDAPRLVGDRIELVADLARQEAFANFSLDDAAARGARKGSDLSGTLLDSSLLTEESERASTSWPHRAALALLRAIDRARATTRSAILRDYAPSTSGLARALVLGENDLDDAESEAFRASGLSHLLAVSGTHLVFAIGFLVKAIEWLLKRSVELALRIDVRRLSSAIAIPLTWVYCIFAGNSGSAVRASWMLSVALFARVLDSKPDAVRAFAWSMIFGAWVEPLAIFDISFVLSIAATAGLFVFTPRMLEWLGGAPKALRSLTFAHTPVAATLGATITCIPLVLPLGEKQGLLGPLANLAAAPLGEWCALPPSLLHPLLTGMHLDLLARIVARIASGSLYLVRAIALGSSRVSVGSGFPPLGGELASFAIFALYFLLETRRLRRLFASALFLVSVWLCERVVRAPRRTLTIESFDVGQGDAALLRLPMGGAVLVDAGGIVGSPIDVGERVVRATLRRERISRLHFAMLSHPHPDHFGGMSAALRDVVVEEFWDTGQGESEGAKGPYADLLGALRERNIPIRRPDTLCGPHEIEGVQFEVFAPCPSFSSARSPNDNSFIVRVTFGAQCALFMGDAEHEEEADFLARTNVHCEVLKVGHHGSRTSSTPALLERLRPTAAIISTGVRNRFGHPHDSTIAGLEAHHVAILRTDLLGGIRLETDGKQWNFSNAFRRSSQGRSFGFLD